MCLTSAALFLFLNLLPADRVEQEDQQITVRADAGAVIWQARGASWCTDAPVSDKGKAGDADQN
jgi:hypothetical protein